MISIRKEQNAFHPNAEQKILNLGNELFGLVRSSEEQTIAFVCNLSDSPKTFEIEAELDQLDYDLISAKNIEKKELKPYQCMWLTGK